MDKIRCVVERVTYESEQTEYTVIKVREQPERQFLVAQVLRAPPVQLLRRHAL